MKKLLAIVLVVAMIFSMTACNSADVEETVAPVVTPAPATEAPATASPTVAPTEAPVATETPTTSGGGSTSITVSLSNRDDSNDNSGGGGTTVVEDTKWEIGDSFANGTDYEYTASWDDAVDNEIIIYDEDYSGTLTIKASSEDTSGLELTIYMPNATVEVYGDYGIVTATTGPNSLHYYGGANMLRVYGGKTVVKNGAEIGELKIPADSTTTEVEVEGTVSDSDIKKSITLKVVEDGEIDINADSGAVVILDVSEANPVEDENYKITVNDSNSGSVYVEGLAAADAGAGTEAETSTDYVATNNNVTANAELFEVTYGVYDNGLATGVKNYEVTVATVSGDNISGLTSTYDFYVNGEKVFWDSTNNYSPSSKELYVRWSMRPSGEWTSGDVYYFDYNNVLLPQVGDVITIEIALTANSETQAIIKTFTMTQELYDEMYWTQNDVVVQAVIDGFDGTIGEGQDETTAIEIDKTKSTTTDLYFTIYQPDTALSVLNDTEFFDILYSYGWVSCALDTNEIITDGNSTVYDSTEFTTFIKGTSGNMTTFAQMLLGNSATLQSTLGDLHNETIDMVFICKSANSEQETKLSAVLDVTLHFTVEVKADSDGFADALAQGGNITLTEDVTLTSETLTIDKATTIDSAGYAIKYDGSLTIDANADLSISGLATAGLTLEAFENGIEVEISDSTFTGVVTLKNVDDTDTYTEYSADIIFSDNTVDFSGYTGDATNALWYNQAYDTDAGAPEGTLVISGNTFKNASEESKILNALTNIAGEVTITGNTFCDVSSAEILVSAYANYDIEISGNKYGETGQISLTNVSAVASDINISDEIYRLVICDKDNSSSDWVEIVNSIDYQELYISYLHGSANPLTIPEDETLEIPASTKITNAEESGEAIVDVSNSGTIAVYDQAGLEIAQKIGGNIEIGAGFVFDSENLFTIEAPVSTTPTTYCIAEGTTLEIPTSMSLVISANATLVNNGTIVLNGKFYNNGTFTNNGTITNDNKIYNETGATFTNNGTVDIAEDCDLTNSGTFTNSENATIVLAVEAALTNNVECTFTNSGIIEVYDEDGFDDATDIGGDVRIMSGTWEFDEEFEYDTDSGEIYIAAGVTVTHEIADYDELIKLDETYIYVEYGATYIIKTAMGNGTYSDAITLVGANGYIQLEEDATVLIILADETDKTDYPILVEVDGDATLGSASAVYSAYVYGVAEGLSGTEYEAESDEKYAINISLSDGEYTIQGEYNADLLIIGSSKLAVDPGKTFTLGEEYEVVLKDNTATFIIEEYATVVLSEGAQIDNTVGEGTLTNNGTIAVCDKDALQGAQDIGGNIEIRFDYELTDNLTLTHDSKYTLAIAEGYTLTVPEGKTLTLTDTNTTWDTTVLLLSGAGKIENKGTITTTTVFGVIQFMMDGGEIESFAGSTLEILIVDPEAYAENPSAYQESGVIIGSTGMNITTGSVILALNNYGNGTIPVCNDYDTYDEYVEAATTFITDHAGYSITITEDSVASIAGHFQDGDADGYRITGKDVLTVDEDASLNISYKTQVSGSLIVNGDLTVINAQYGTDPVYYPVLEFITTGSDDKYVGTLTGSGYVILQADNQVTGISSITTEGAYAYQNDAWTEVEDDYDDDQTGGTTPTVDTVPTVDITTG